MGMHIDLQHPASFRDPCGFIFERAGQLFRQVNLVAQPDYDRFMQSGLYEQLTKQKSLISHFESTEPALLPELAYKILEPQKVDFISYPYEWSFSQLKAAALLTLEIQEKALKKGMTLKDANAYNIQFRNGKPILIDTLSFTELKPGQPWQAYGQFCRHFLAPLALMALTDIRLNQLLRVHLDGIPLDLASKLLPAKTWLNLGLLSHIHLHAKSQLKYAKDPVQKKEAQLKPETLTHLISHLKSTVKALTWKPENTEWGDYYEATNYSRDSFDAKIKLVQELAKVAKPKTVWDLGANTGEFSKAIMQDVESIIAFDADPAAVELNYLNNKNPKILPLLMDLVNPSPMLGWENQERDSLLKRGPADLTMALALVHHLAISNNVPLLKLAQFFAKAGKFLLIEFVPKTDSQVKKLLATRSDIFPEYTQSTFEAIFSTVFRIEAIKPIPGTERTLYLMQAR
jgi:ribosomal protein L11 methylase PrmA